MHVEYSFLLSLQQMESTQTEKHDFQICIGGGKVITWRTSHSHCHSRSFLLLIVSFCPLFFPNKDSRRLFHLVNNLFYTTGSKEDEFISISNLDEERVEHLVCSEGMQAASSKMIFHKLQLSGMLGFLKLSRDWKSACAFSFSFKAVRFMPKSTES